MQIRLSKQEYEELRDFIKRFDVTKREWLMTVVKELEHYNIIRDGQFWSSHKEYAYEHNHEWDKKLKSDSVCEVCHKRFPERQHGHGLQRHHHDGYEGQNAFKVHIVCQEHHGLAHKAMRAGISWTNFLKDLLGKPIK